MKQVTKVIADVAPRHQISDVEAFTQEILAGLGFGESPKKEAKEKDGSVVSDGASGRKRVVSKKMKEAFLALEGADEEKLKEAMKSYKEAAEVDSFDALDRQMLGLTLAPAPEPKVKKEKKAKVEKSARFTPNTTSRKLFKTIVEESGGDWKTILECDLTKFIDGLTDEEFASASIQGHMRAYVATVVAAKAAAAPVVDWFAEKPLEELAEKQKAKAAVVPEKKPVEKKKAAETPPNGGAGKASSPPPDEDDDEDMEEIEFDGETLMIGVKSGKIYQTTEEAGDVLIGVAGKGRFKKVVKPSA